MTSTSRAPHHRGRATAGRRRAGTTPRHRAEAAAEGLRARLGTSRGPAVAGLALAAAAVGGVALVPTLLEEGGTGGGGGADRAVDGSSPRALAPATGLSLVASPSARPRVDRFPTDAPTPRADEADGPRLTGATAGATSAPAAGDRDRTTDAGTGPGTPAGTGGGTGMGGGASEPERDPARTPSPTGPTDRDTGGNDPGDGPGAGPGEGPDGGGTSVVDRTVESVDRATEPVRKVLPSPVGGAVDDTVGVVEGTVAGPLGGIVP